MATKNEEVKKVNGKTEINYYKLDSPLQLQELLGSDLSRLSLLYFRAGWAEVCKTADPFVRSLSEKWKEPLYLEIEAESLPDVAESFEVTSVPSFIILRGHRLLSRIVGAKLKELENDFEKFVKKSNNQTDKTSTNTNTSTDKKVIEGEERDIVGSGTGIEEEEEEETEEKIFERCKTLMNQSKVVLFMKGDPKTPRCGFSQKTVKILEDLKIEFTTFDILTDENIRQGMKKLNSWPTFPQLIIKGELVGGLDILKEMIQKVDDGHGNSKSELEQLLED